jgi:hypothetical protein
VKEIINFLAQRTEQGSKSILEIDVLIRATYDLVLKESQDSPISSFLKQNSYVSTKFIGVTNSLRKNFKELLDIKKQILDLYIKEKELLIKLGSNTINDNSGAYIAPIKDLNNQISVLISKSRGILKLAYNNKLELINEESDIQEIELAKKQISDSFANNNFLNNELKKVISVWIRQFLSFKESHLNKDFKDEGDLFNEAVTYREQAYVISDLVSLLFSKIKPFSLSEDKRKIFYTMLGNFYTKCLQNKIILEQAGSNREKEIISIWKKQFKPFPSSKVKFETFVDKINLYLENDMVLPTTEKKPSNKENEKIKDLESKLHDLEKKLGDQEPVKIDIIQTIQEIVQINLTVEQQKIVINQINKLEQEVENVLNVQQKLLGSSNLPLLDHHETINTLQSIIKSVQNNTEFSSEQLPVIQSIKNHLVNQQQNPILAMIPQEMYYNSDLHYIGENIKRFYEINLTTSYGELSDDIRALIVSFLKNFSIEFIKYFNNKTLNKSKIKSKFYLLVELDMLTREIITNKEKINNMNGTIIRIKNKYFE